MLPDTHTHTHKHGDTEVHGTLAIYPGAWNLKRLWARELFMPSSLPSIPTVTPGERLVVLPEYYPRAGPSIMVKRNNLCEPALSAGLLQNVPCLRTNLSIMLGNQKVLPKEWHPVYLSPHILHLSHPPKLPFP